MSRPKHRIASALLLICTAGVALAEPSDGPGRIQSWDEIEIDAAIALVTRGLQREPTDASLYQLRATLLAQKQAWTGVIDDCSKVIELDPNNAEAFRYRAGARLNENAAGRNDKQEFLRAIHDLTNAIKLNPRDHESLSLRGWTWERIGESQNALSDYSASIQIDSHVGMTFFRRGRLHKTAGRHESALSDLTEAIKLLPSNPAIYHSRSYVWETLGNETNSLADLERTINVGIKGSERFAARANADLELMKYDRAVGDFSSTIKVEPKNASAFEGRAWAEMALGRLQDACDDFSESIRLDPMNVNAYRGRSHARSLSRELSSALDDLDAAARIAPNDPKVLAARGKIYFAIDSFAKANADFQRSLQFDPVCVDACEGLALLESTCWDAAFIRRKSAIDHGINACELTLWRNPTALCAAAAAHARDGRFDGAVRLQRHAIKMAKDDRSEMEFRERLKLYESKGPYSKPPFEKGNARQQSPQQGKLK